MRWTARLGIAAACALPILLPIAWVLGARVPNVIETPLVEAGPSREAVPIELSYLDYPGRAGAHAAVIMLQLQRADSLAAHARIDLLVVTYSTTPRLLRAILDVEGTDCRFESRPGARYPNNGKLALLRSRECGRMNGTPTGRLKLQVKFNGPGRVGLWTYRSPGESIDPSRIYLTDPTYAELGVLCDVRANYVDEFGLSYLRRVDLLAYVWQVGTSRAMWIWLALGLCGALLAVAALAIPTAVQFGALRIAVAAGSAAFGLASLYAVLVPPFQVADEPGHFITLLADIGRPELAKDATELGRRGHFERIHFHPDERFRPIDRNVLGPPINDGGAPEPSRGMGGRYLWRAVAPFIRALDVAQLLLVMRIINAMIFAVAVATFLLLTTQCADVREPRWLALPLFLIPTLPFFAMHVSNYAPLTSVYVVLGAGVLVSMFGGPKSHRGGIIVGVAVTLAILISRSALPLTPFVASLSVARVLTGGGAKVTPRSTMFFWAGLTMPICCGAWLLQWQYFEALAAAAAIGHSGWRRADVALLVAVAGVAGYAAERAAAYLWRRLETTQPWPATPHVGRLVALLVATSMVASLMGFAPVLEMIDPAHPPAPAAYVRAALRAGVTLFRPGSPDFLTSIAFWQGFGWLDTIPSVVLASLLATASGIAFVCLLVSVGGTRGTRLLIWICCTIVGYAGAFAAYALSVIRLTPADLHGRYLIGLYLCMLLIAWSGVARLRSSNRPIFNAGPAAMAVVCAAIHGYCLAAILQRYF